MKVEYVQTLKHGSRIHYLDVNVSVKFNSQKKRIRIFRNVVNLSINKVICLSFFYF